MKGNLTPFMAYAANKFNGMGCSYSEFKKNVLSNDNIPYKKKLNLLNEENKKHYAEWFQEVIKENESKDTIEINNDM